MLLLTVNILNYLPLREEDVNFSIYNFLFYFIVKSKFCVLFFSQLNKHQLYIMKAANTLDVPSSATRRNDVFSAQMRDAGVGYMPQTRTAVTSTCLCLYRLRYADSGQPHAATVYPGLGHN